MLEFLLGNDILLKSNVNNRWMTADTTENLDGEFVVYERGNDEDIYRGRSLEKAMELMNE